MVPPNQPSTNLHHPRQLPTAHGEKDRILRRTLERRGESGKARPCDLNSEEGNWQVKRDYREFIKPLGAGSDKFVNESGYLCSSDGEAIHRKVYKEKHGKIPKGWHVHHIDYDKYNNDIDNLIAIPEILHNEIHRKFDKANRPNRTSIMMMWNSHAQLSETAIRERIRPAMELLSELSRIDLEVVKKELRQLISHRKRRVTYKFK